MPCTPAAPPRGATDPRRALASGVGRCACRARAPPWCRRPKPHRATAACWVRCQQGLRAGAVQAPGDEVHSKRPMPPKEEHQPPHRQNKGARPARLARARSLAHPIARACVAASRPRIPAPLAARSPTRNARRGRSPQSLPVGEPRHAWRVGLCVVHRGGASRPAGQNGGQPRSGVPSRGSGWLARTDQVLLARLAVGHAEVRSWVR